MENRIEDSHTSNLEENNQLGNFTLELNHSKMINYFKIEKIENKAEFKPIEVKVSH
jgi:hypothetical protein